jgi:hypothetical protein
MPESPAFNWIPVAYLIYGLASSVLTIWLARTLGKNGRVFLEDVFSGDPALGDAVNRLLVVGFYLVNFGWACLHLSARGLHQLDLRAAIELLADKMGELLLMLALMHFLNLFVFNRIRRSMRGVALVPPVLPQAQLGVAVPTSGSMG